MCGIVGVLTKNKFGLYNNQVNTFQHLLIADQVRGVDGTGVFYTGKDLSPKVKKNSVPAIKLLQQKDWENVRQEILLDSNFVVGHNRYSTKGGNTYNNTHPFKEGHITLVHNGTLYSHKHLKDVEVDSHAICHSIAERGIETTLNDINGAFALVWYDHKQERLFFIRNKERPLALYECDDCWFIASEDKMLDWALSRNNIKVKEKLDNIPVHTLYCYDPKTKELSKTYLDIKPKYPITNYPNVSKHSKYNDYYDDYYSARWLPPVKEEKATIVKPNQESGKITLGSRKEFNPFKVNKMANGSFYIEGYIQLDNGYSEVEVRYYNKDENYLNKLVKEETLECIVFQEAFIRGESYRYYVVKDVTMLPKSANGEELNKNLITALSNKCACCSSLVNKSPATLAYCHIELTKHRGYQLFCPDCTESMGNKKQKLELVH